MDEPFATLLAGKDRRSIGQAGAVLAALDARPARLPELFACLCAADGLVRFRAFDVLEKWSASRPAVLQPLHDALLSGELDDGSAEVRWHLHALCARLTLDAPEAQALLSRLEADVSGHASRIVRVMALQAAHDLCRAHPRLLARWQALLALALASPVPALRARARRWARQLA